MYTLFKPYTVKKICPLLTFLPLGALDEYDHNQPQISTYNNMFTVFTFK